MADEEVKALLERMQSETRRQIEDTNHHFDVVAEGLESEIRDTNRHFDVVAEGLESQIRTIAEGLLATNEKFDRRFDTLEAKVDRSAAETQAMIKFSHADLDPRIRTLEDGHKTLEETVSDLQTRVERLESSSTH